MGLIHCIYASAATQALSEEELGALLRHARTNNSDRGLSGILLHVDSNFFQVLEGEAQAVDSVYQRIALDPRHENLTVIIHEPIARRAFADWSMGFATLAASQIGEILGTNDFFTERSCLHQLNGGRAKKLLSAFANGRWRSGPLAQICHAP